MGKKKKEKTPEELAEEAAFEAMLGDFTTSLKEEPAAGSKKKGKKGKNAAPEPVAEEPPATESAPVDPANVEISVPSDTAAAATTKESTGTKPDVTCSPDSLDTDAPPSDGQDQCPESGAVSDAVDSGSNEKSPDKSLSEKGDTEKAAAETGTSGAATADKSPVKAHDWENEDEETPAVASTTAEVPATATASSTDKPAAEEKEDDEEEEPVDLEPWVTQGITKEEWEKLSPWAKEGLTKKEWENKKKKIARKIREAEDKRLKRGKWEVKDLRPEIVKDAEKKQKEDAERAEKEREEAEKRRLEQEERDRIRMEQEEVERQNRLKLAEIRAVEKLEEKKLRQKRNYAARRIQRCAVRSVVFGEKFKVIREKIAEKKRIEEEKIREELAALRAAMGVRDEDIAADDADEEAKKVKIIPYAISPDPRPHMNIVFVGHVDAGKSTTCGNILYTLGQVDERMIEKYKREAVEKNRDSWFLAYIMDTSEEERAKGKTVDVGRARFETTNKRFTILDAPGHKSYVPNMIAGASQADVAVLIISARRGEFESGFEKGGQTREHALLIKSLGSVQKVLIAVNKMDDVSVEWNESRYNDIVTKLEAFMLSDTIGFTKDQVEFLPISGLRGTNLVHPSAPGLPDWAVERKINVPLLQILDELETPEIQNLPSVEVTGAADGTSPKSNGVGPESPGPDNQGSEVGQNAGPSDLGASPGDGQASPKPSVNVPSNKDMEIRIPMLDGFKDRGYLMAVGKIERGMIKPNTQCIIEPIGKPCLVEAVYVGEQEVTHVGKGENVVLKVSAGLGENSLELSKDLCKGFVLTNVGNRVAPAIRALTKIKAKLKIHELNAERMIFTQGFECIFHCHTSEEHCHISKLISVESNINQQKALQKGKDKPSTTSPSKNTNAEKSASSPDAANGSAAPAVPVTQPSAASADSTAPLTKITMNPKYALVGQTVTCVIKFSRAVAVESMLIDPETGYVRNGALSRFTLRDQMCTVGMGEVLELPAK